MDLKQRTYLYGIEVLKFLDTLPENPESSMLSNQLRRSSTSVGANYRAARCSKSKKDFINKLKISEEEADESFYWLSLAKERKIGDAEEVNKLIKETQELLAIIITSIKTARRNLHK